MVEDNGETSLGLRVNNISSKKKTQNKDTDCFRHAKIKKCIGHKPQTERVTKSCTSVKRKEYPGMPGWLSW